MIGSYINNEGDMDALFEEVMLSNPLDDEKRFREIIDEEIAAKRVEGYPAYVKESKAKRKKRVTEAKKEAQEAMDMAEELGVKEKLFGGDGTSGASPSKKKGKKAEEDLGGLAALIQQRQKSRQDTFFDSLEAKYAPKSKKGNGVKAKRGARVMEEPPEEAFQQNRKKTQIADDENGEEAESTGSRRTKRARKG